ncbi:MAG: sensor histidine kinase [Paracoccaceae bacterium]|nr:MAG: sensor histidine kinase [Paracoccaceae bacterium]
MSATDALGPPYSLRRRLMVAMLAGFAVIMTVLSLGLWTYARNAADTTFDLLLDGAAIAILDSVTVTPAGLTVDLPNSALEILGLAERERVFYRIATREGEVLTGDAALPLPPGSVPRGAPRAGRTLFDAPFGGETVRFVQRVQEVPGASGPVWVAVQVGQTRGARDAVQRDLFVKGLVGLSVLALIGLFFVRAAIHLAMRPLAGIEADIQGRDPANLAPLKALPPREIAGLIAAINGFMRRLGSSKDNAEAFIADVAHQIRTSLSALRGQLELASETAEPVLQRARVAKAADQAARTIRLTNQLLAHAMVMHRADTAPREAVDMVAIARGLIEETIRAPGDAGEPDFEVMVEPGAEALRVPGDAVSLREAMRNLIDNALRHAGPAPLVRIALAEDVLGRSPALELRVEDNGPGIAAADRARALERFASLGASGGSGLGLAIVVAAVAAHGGRFELDTSPEGGLSARITLPAEVAQAAAA